MALLIELVRDPVVGIAAIAAHLDAVDAGERSAQALSLDRADQRLLYDKAAHAPAIELAHFVGDAIGEVIHDGRNTLPLPALLRTFQKRFCRSTDPSRVFGYNEGISRRVVGPGYFVAVPTAGRPAWTARGAIVVDYYQVPDGPVPAGWPRVVPNDHGLQRFVYRETRDFMRRVSSHVSIGAAYKAERPLDHYFVLCRRA
ncbi:MAG: hypothetical protein ABI867_18655 [Kofleriaceae bacterium]